MIPWDAPVATGPVHATVTVPGSKSASARAYLLAALAEGPSELFGVLDARDTRLMRAALEDLGTQFTDTDEGSVLVTPPAAFTGGGTLECGLSGTVMRFVPPVAALARGVTRFVGDPGAESRPVAPLLDALRELGVAVVGDRLPFEVTGSSSLTGGEVAVDASASSQFITALLLSGCRFPQGLTVRALGQVPSMPHIEMTLSMLRARGVTIQQPDQRTWQVQPGTIRAARDVVEPDLTNAATLCAAALITRGTITTAWPQDSVQAGGPLLAALAAFGADVGRVGDQVIVDGSAGIRGADVDLHQISELTCAVAALAALAEGPSRIRGVAHIRGHETDRLNALTGEITNLGGNVIETEDGLLIQPAPLHGGLFGTHSDHRMAHAGALLGLVVPGITLDDLGCTTKTLPDFAGLWTSMLAGA
ncbi:MAG: 3-phosphoshikimate 1-carboxyvinyltransferase [Micropruina sp.]|nr:3-phosphoshikimate 1-carboxyvinyltransferase [Micropruina sp.]